MVALYVIHHYFTATMIESILIIFLTFPPKLFLTTLVSRPEFPGLVLLSAVCSSYPFLRAALLLFAFEITGAK